MAVTPLQLARAYAALANGGTLYSPRLGEELLSPSGKVVQKITPPVDGHLPATAGTLAYIRSALGGVLTQGTAAGAFGGFPLGKVCVAGKTGTAQVAGNLATSVFASFAPCGNPKYVVVMMIPDSGFGADVSAPAVRQIWDDIYGLEGHKAALAGGSLPTAPHVNRAGQIVPNNQPHAKATRRARHRSARHRSARHGPARHGPDRGGTGCGGPAGRRSGRRGGGHDPAQRDAAARYPAQTGRGDRSRPRPGRGAVMTFTKGSRDLSRPSPARPGPQYRGLAPLDRGPGFGGSGSSLGTRHGLGQRLRGLARRAFARKSPLRHLDWILLATVLALSLVGTLLVWAATEPGLAKAGLDTHTYLMKQLLNIALGLVLMGAVALLDYRQLRMYAPVMYVLSVLGLVIVLTPLGTAVNGALSWINLPGGFQIEPSEYAKLSIILISAMLLGELRQGEQRPRLRAVGIALGIAAVPIVLVEAEPDLGVVILMLALIIGLIALSGVRLRWLARRRWPRPRWPCWPSSTCTC